MGMLADRPFVPREQRPRLERLLHAGRRELLVVSPVVHIRAIHYVTDRSVPCEGGVPLCSWCSSMEPRNYGYVFCKVLGTEWHESVGAAHRVNPDPPWCFHELTEPAAREVLALGERESWETLRGRRLYLTRSKGGRFGRQHCLPNRSCPVAEIDARIVAPEPDVLLRYLYFSQGRLNFGEKSA